MRYTPNGNPVTSFSVATNRRWTSADGEQQEETEWFRVNAWNRLAETCNQYVSKGMKVYVEGRLKSSPWMGNDGQPRAGNEISAAEIKCLDGASQTPGDSEASNTGDIEDLPW